MAAQLEAAASIVLVREVGDAPRGHLLGCRAGGQERLAQPRLAGDERLAVKQLPQRVQPALGLAGERVPEALVAVDGRVDLVARVVILEDDGDPAHLRQPAHGSARVGGHQVREVGRALGRGEPQAHVDVPVGRHVARGHEPQRRDRLVQLGVEDRPERVEDVGGVRHAPLSTSCASSWAAGVPPFESWSSAGTSTSYSFAALRPRIFFFDSVVKAGKSENVSSG